MTSRARLHALLAALAIFVLNAWICQRLFAVDFIGNLQSNEAAFISIARFYRDHPLHLRWFPWFNGGMPIENAYQPVLPALAALTSALTAWPVARAFHFVLALAYSLGPVFLFWMVLEWTSSLLPAALAGVAASVISPGPLLIPALRAAQSGASTPLRIYNLVFYGEGPHVVAVALLPLAFLFLRRAILRRDAPSLTGAILFCSAVVLANAFGAVALALGSLCIVLALRRGALVTVLVGIAAWLLSSPWLPPALIETMRRNAWTARGFYNAGPAAYISLVLLLGVFGAAWVWTRRIASPFERFVVLFTPWMCALPIAALAANVTLVPQAHRYQLEMEVAICLALACLIARLLTLSTPAIRWIAAAALLVAFAASARHDRNFAHDLIRPIDITQTVEYKAARWIDQNLAGRRVMVSGDAAFLFNVFSDNPQLSGGHEPTAPNFLQQIAVYQIYTGDHANEKDAEVSLLWLKAFGVDAITVPGPSTHELYKPFVNPAKFDGVVPVLWREDGDAIYGVPRPAPTLAHVIPRSAAVSPAPIHGMDLAQLRPYVAALDNSTLPAASLRWDNPSLATIQARVSPQQVVSLQVTWDPAWHAETSGRPVPVLKDGLGQIILDPRCDSTCTITLAYGATSAIWFFRVASFLVVLGLAVLLLTRRRHPKQFTDLVR